MSSSRCSAVRVLRLRVKDKHAAWLCGFAREVNFVFNACEAVHDRNVNAAHIILAAGHRRLAEGILGS
jgi:hypothetical protein